MKFVMFFVCFTAAMVAVFANTSGQSACRDPSELGQTYPHHFDHTAFWYCEKSDEPAKLMQCPEGFAYMHKLRECIPWPNWIWKKPENPPTLA